MVGINIFRSIDWKPPKEASYSGQRPDLAKQPCQSAPSVEKLRESCILNLLHATGRNRAKHVKRAEWVVKRVSKKRVKRDTN